MKLKSILVASTVLFSVVAFATEDQEANQRTQEQIEAEQALAAEQLAEASNAELVELLMKQCSPYPHCA